MTPTSDPVRLPFLRPKPTADRARAAPVLDDAATIEAARTRARRRLVGALVLLVIGVAVFPLVFETQPRPLPLDTPIAARVQGGGASALPAPARNARGTGVLPVLPAETVVDAGAPAGPAVTPAPEPAPVLAPVPAPVQAAAPTPDLAPAPAAVPSATTPPSPAPQTASAPQPASTAASAAARFVVQIGAYADAATLRDARLRVEKLGLKTYTQIVDTPGGQRTRVRVGPFGTRDEADVVAGKVKRNGLPANIVAI